MPSRASKLTRIALAAAISLSGAVAATAFTTTTAQAVGSSATGGSIFRSEVLARAQDWVNQNVPYSQTSYWTDSNGTYRQDCSGFVSMAWHIDTAGTNNGFSTGTASGYSTELGSLDDLRPGDAINNISTHMVLFASWTDSSHTAANIYEEAHTGTNARARTMLRSEMTSGGFLPFRYKNIVDDPAPSPWVNTVHLVDLTPDGGLHNVEGNYDTHSWNTWSDMGASGIKQVTSASTGSTNRIFAIGSDNHIYEKDGNYGTTQWTGWFQPEASPTVTAISASSFGNTVHLVAIGTDGQLYNSDGTFPNGGWNGWSGHGGTGLKRVASASTANNVNHIFVVDSGNQLQEIDADYAAHSWSSWSPAANGFTGQDVTAAAFGNTVHLDAIGMDGNLYNAEGNYDAWSWSVWSNMGGSGLKRLTSATSSVTNVNHIFAINSSNRLVEIDADYNTRSWNNWAEPAGGADSIGLTATFTS